MKFEWKMGLAMCVLALAVFPLVAADVMPRSEWHNLVSECAQNAQTLRETMAKVSPADQAALLAEVNEAIAKMPGNDEVKGAMFYAANSAAVRSAAPGNLATVLAEVFATVPPEFLTDINERFAKEIFNRSANPSRTFSDSEFETLAKNTMTAINARCEKAENAGVRETFAILMFLRASNGTPANLADTLVATMPDAKNRELALGEWIKPAMGDGQEQTYDPMLGVAQAGEEPDHAVVTSLTGSPDVMVGLLADLAAEGSPMATSAAKMGAGAFLAPTIAGAAPDSQPDIGLNRIPRGYIASKEAVGGNADGTAADNGEGNPYYSNKRGSTSGSEGGYTPEPGPYAGQ